MGSRRNPAEFEDLIAAIAASTEARGIAFMLVGGQAVLLHGIPRLTQDVDIALGLAPDEVDRVLDLCTEVSLQPLPDDPRRFARDRFVLPAFHPATGIRVDFIFSTIPYEREALQRAVRVPVGGVDVPFAATEDLILYKLFAGRPRDLEDVAGIVHRNGPQIDWSYIEKWARQFSVIDGRENLPDQVRVIRQIGSG